MLKQLITQLINYSINQSTNSQTNRPEWHIGAICDFLCFRSRNIHWSINQSTIPFINRPFKHYISQLLLRGFSLCYRMNKSHNQSIHHFINNLLNPNLSNVVSLDVVDLVHRAVAGKRDGQVIPAVVDCKRRRKKTLKSEGKQCKEKEITGKIGKNGKKNYFSIICW